MKKLIFASMGFVTLSIGNAGAVLCTDFGPAMSVAPPYTELAAKNLIKTCSLEDAYSDSHCATLDYTITFVTFFDDGSCRYLPSCATCPDGYKLDPEPVEFKVGDICYVDDGMIGGNDQDMLDELMYEYYVCTKIPVYCVMGYYGSTTDGTTGCTRCPTWSGVYTDAAKTTEARGTSRSSYNDSITDCYIETGTYYDVTGMFNIDSICDYHK